MNKKGVQLSLNAIIGMVMAIIVILLTLGFFISLYLIFFSSSIDEVTTANWKFLINQIEALEDNPDIDHVDFLLYSAGDFSFTTLDPCAPKRICLCDKDGCDEKKYKSERLNIIIEIDSNEMHMFEELYVKPGKVYKINLVREKEGIRIRQYKID